VANYEIIRDVGRRLRALLWEGLRGDAAIGLNAEADIGFEPPLGAGDDTRELSVWLYQIVENEFSKNRSTQRAANDEEQVAPLALNLFYLVTPQMSSIDADQLLLGRVMQILHDNARTVVDNVSAGGRTVTEEISISLYRRTLEELTRIWDALREPYRLSVCYEVRLARIDSNRRVRGGRVGERELAEEVLS
jgi:hypothetical protein